MEVPSPVRNDEVEEHAVPLQCAVPLPRKKLENRKKQLVRDTDINNCQASRRGALIYERKIGVLERGGQRAIRPARFAGIRAASDVFRTSTRAQTFVTLAATRIPSWKDPDPRKIISRNRQLFIITFSLPRLRSDINYNKRSIYENKCAMILLSIPRACRASRYLSISRGCNLFSTLPPPLTAMKIKVHDLAEFTIHGGARCDRFAKIVYLGIAKSVSRANKHEPRVYLRDRKKRKQFSLATVEQTTNFSNIAAARRGPGSYPAERSNLARALLRSSSSYCAIV